MTKQLRTGAMESSLSQLLLLGSALAIGLLVGLERGWSNRKLADGKRVAGLRTFGLTGLLGGVSGLLATHLGGFILGIIFAAVAALVIATYLINHRHSLDIGATSHVAMLVTFLLGALAALDQVVVAAACGVVTTLLLRSKLFLHRLLLKLSQHELNAGLNLLIISLVLLPALPNKGYGPWQALNPYEIWWMVVLISAISFAGYFMIRMLGAQRGILMTGLAGGMISSTALTLQLSRLSRDQPSLQLLCSVGILVACGVMFPRILLVAGLINPALVADLFLPLALMLGVIFGCTALIFHNDTRPVVTDEVRPKNPLELKPALLFGLMLAAVALLVRVMVEWLGESGVLLLAVASGIADVDAINLTLSRMAGGDIPPNTAVLGIVLASVSNTLFKACLAVFSGGKGMVRWVMLPLLLVAATGLLTIWLQ
ncbi:MgtC/SapB family protein [Moritella sp. Urea-trap-13]|uniref:MgtC/SapB family protein n=1 Tax=Moritella sp. Urea-trap-13 TaxID=2058327 RepID=UPI001E42C3DA|nr:MgtC/SapB family protein [Moritella sp. Urea-trap-13]